MVKHNHHLDILEHEYRIRPGEYFNVDTNFVGERTVMNIIIDQDNYFAELFSIYPIDETRHFVIYLKQTPKGSIYRTNYPLEMKEHSDEYRVLYE